MLPHITQSQAGNNKFEPVYNSLFEVYFDIPAALTAKGFTNDDKLLLSEHVKTVSGLDSLTKGPGVVEQKFMGTTRSYLAPKLDNTSCEITIAFTLNLRNAIDNYIFRFFQEWNKLGYDLATGKTALKTDYCAPFVQISIGNRAGQVFREIIFKDVMMIDGFTTQDQLDYSSNEPVELSVKLRSDWFEERNCTSDGVALSYGSAE